MAYDYTKASDLVSWCKEQKNKANAYRLGGIGRYENGVRIFDCVGLIKCFIWHDYSSSNASYYGKTCPDKNETGFFNEATEKGTIDTIPEIPGLMVYQPGHIGVYLGNGQVIESTAAFDKKIVITYFKGNHPDTSYKRTTWTHWFKMPYLTYDAQESVEASEDTYELVVACKIYMNSDNAANHKDSVGTYDAGTYYVFNKANGMINVTKTKGTAGGWINPNDNVKETASTPSTDESFEHALDETVRFTTCYRSSTDAAACKNYISANQMMRDTGKITRRLKVNGVSTYLLDNGLCWVNDGDIAGSSTVDLNAVAKKVYNGDYGNGQERKDKLKAEGYTDAQIKEIQSIVNKMCA